MGGQITDKMAKSNAGLKYRDSKAIIVKDAEQVVEAIQDNSGLTANQKHFLEYMLSLEELPNTIKELVTKGNTTSQSFYQWVKELAFLEAFNRVCDVVDALDRPWIDKANREKAKAGDIGAQRTYYLRRGLLGGNNQPQTAIQVNFGALDNKVG